VLSVFSSRPEVLEFQGFPEIHFSYYKVLKVIIGRSHTNKSYFRRARALGQLFNKIEYFVHLLRRSETIDVDRLTAIKAKQK